MTSPGRSDGRLQRRLCRAPLANASATAKAERSKGDRHGRIGREGCDRHGRGPARRKRIMGGSIRSMRQARPVTASKPACRRALLLKESPQAIGDFHWADGGREHHIGAHPRYRAAGPLRRVPDNDEWRLLDRGIMAQGCAEVQELHVRDGPANTMRSSGCRRSCASAPAPSSV
jgi:hypothetical protein